MAHYYTENPDAAHEIRTIALNMDGKAFAFDTDAGVFSKQHVDPGSLLLIESARPCNGRVLDLGCGYGPIGITLASAFPNAEFLLCDVNRRAVELAQNNIRKNNIKNARAQFSDGCANLEGTFDMIISNPPIRIGKAALQDMWRDCYDRLNADGKFCIVIRKAQGAPSAKKFLEELFGNCETIARGSGYHILLSTK